MSLRHFLILYDVERQELIEAQDLGTNVGAAATAYAAKERECREREDIEIVLIGADSLDTIRRTHPHYFDGAAADGFFFDVVVPEWE